MRSRHLGLLGIILALCWAPAAIAATQDKAQDSKKPEGAECRGCHEDKLAAFDRTPHAGAPDGCVSCHTGGHDHMNGRMEG